MIFTHVEKNWNIPDENIQRVTVNGKRRYRVGDKDYYSITTILSKYKGDGIQKWRRRIGPQKADEIVRRAGNNGTQLHRMCEHYIMNEDISKLMVNPMNKEMFQTIRPSIDRYINNIHVQESYMYSHILKIAGAVDLIADWDGELTVIDFKTSLNPKREEWIENYYMQATAYACMFFEMTGIPVKKIVLPMLVTNTMEMQIWKTTPAKWIRPLHSRVKDFYRRYAD